MITGTTDEIYRLLSQKRDCYDHRQAHFSEALIIKKVLVFHSLILNKDITRTIILGTLIFQQTMQHLIGLG